MSTIIRYVLLTALRDKLFIGMLVGIVVTTWISAVLASTSMVETQEMSLVFSAAAARIILVIGMVVFIAFHIRQSFENKEIDVMLSRPISRPQLVFAYWIGFSFIASIMVICIAAIIFYVSPLNQIGYIVWAMSLLFEALLIVAMSLFTSLLMRSAVLSVLVCFGFYLLSRMMGYFLATIEGRSTFRDAFLNMMSKSIIDISSVIVPRLDFYSKTEWLIYGLSQGMHEVMLVLGQTLVFVPLLLLASVIDFKRKQF